MTATVASLVQAAQRDADLRKALVSHPQQVAQKRQLPVLVAQAAALALRGQTAEHGVWY